MKKSKQRIIAIVLLISLALWIVISVIPKGTSGRSSDRQVAPSKAEPPFTKEAELAILDTSGTDVLMNLDIELAESVAEIQYGMMYRKSMDRNMGMLFIMGSEAPRSFYMKNTYVPLDIIFINDDMKIVSIQKNAKPLDETSLPSEGPASLVLEVKGGLSDELGLVKGQKIRWNRLH